MTEEPNFAGLPIKTNPDLPPNEINFVEANRWAAFTNDELGWFADAIESVIQLCKAQGLPYIIPAVHHEMEAELERRK